MIKYLGSKRLLIPDILGAIGSVRERGTVLDLFAGTSRVGHALKRAGYRVLANDHNAYAHTLAKCYVEADAEDVREASTQIVADLNELALGAPGACAPTGHRAVATGGVGASPTEPVVSKGLKSSPRRGEGIDPSGIQTLPRPSGADKNRPRFPRVPLEDSLHPWLHSSAPMGLETPNTTADFFTQTYCLNSRFFHPKNGPRIHAIREDIRRRQLPSELHAIALVSLMEAADRVDSTTGVQMAYLKQWAPRALNDVMLRVPEVLPRAASGKGSAFCMDAAAAARELASEADVIYIDPPYNQHSYLGNYHIWETLVRWDKPEVYGTACKRVDCRERKSAFNSKRAMREAFEEVLEACGDTALVVSFSDEGYLSREEIGELLSPRGRVRVIERDYKRYVGAQIGIYNPSGERVGKVSHLRNTEMLFVVTPRRPAPVGTATVRERKRPTGSRARIRRAAQVSAP